MPAEHYRHLSELADRYWWHWTRRALLSSCAGRFVRPIAAYVDVGCGLGIGTRLAARDLVRAGRAIPGVRTLGIDHPSLRQRHQLGDSGEFAAVDFDERPPGILPGLPSSSAGPVLFSCMDVLEHLREPVALAAAIAASMGAEDLALFTVPALQRLWSDWDVRLGHLRRYTREGLVRELEQAGLEVLESSYLFSWAVLPGLVRARRKQAGDVEFPAVPGPVNAALRWLGWLEIRLGRLLPIPLGTSAWALVRRRPGKLAIAA